MKYRSFGSTGFLVSALGMGCMRLPTRGFLPQKIDVPKAVKLIRTAIDKGVNYFDTAWPYHLGESEKVLGKALRDGYRERVHVVTKLPMFMIAREKDFDFYLHSSLKRLQTDYIDTYLFHALNKASFEKLKKFNFLEKMLDAKELGIIKYIGFSFHDTLPVFKEIVDYYDWDVVQIQYNYMDTAIQATRDGLKYVAEKNMAVVIMEPLKGGQLANPPREARDIMATATQERSAVDWALQYLWNLPEVSLVISGMGNLKMLNENCASADTSGIGTLDAEALNIIDRLVAVYRKNICVPCTDCKYCLPCPYGVNIPLHFSTVNNLAMDQNLLRRVVARRTYKSLVTSKSRLNAKKSNGRATLCVECGVCIPKCPQGINIPEELKKTLDVLDHGKSIQDVFG